jgi:hypothetical protein
VISVLTTGPEGHGFEPGQGDGFLRAKMSGEYVSTLQVGSARTNVCFAA